MNWARITPFTGLLAILIYFASVFGLVPGGFRVVYPVFWLFGPSMVLFGIGIYHFFVLQQGDSLTLQIGKIFWVLAGFGVTLVGTFQGVAREAFGLTTSMKFPEGTSEAIRNGFTAANSIQSGADLTWDIFIFGAYMAFGLVMIKATLKWKIMGWLAILIATLGIAFNFAAWPANPMNAGLIDAGPFAGVWGLILSILVYLENRSDRLQLN